MAYEHKQPDDDALRRLNYSRRAERLQRYKKRQWNRKWRYALRFETRKEIEAVTFSSVIVRVGNKVYAERD